MCSLIFINIILLTLWSVFYCPKQALYKKWFEVTNFYCSLSSYNHWLFFDIHIHRVNEYKEPQAETELEHYVVRSIEEIHWY